jgi:ribosomal protein L37AE/L43A
MNDALTGSGLPHRSNSSDSLEQANAAAAPCPACGSPRVIPVLYGSSSSELIAAYAAGRIAIGGARAVEGSPRWECRDCDHRWADAAPGTFS